MKLLVSPHNDDAALFCAYAAQRHRPHVLTVFDSYVQAIRYPQCNAEARRNEDRAALAILGCEVSFGGLRDDIQRPEKLFSDTRDLLARWKQDYSPTEVWLPLDEMDGHLQHNAVASAGFSVFGGHATIHYYATYTRTKGKSTTAREVVPTGGQVLKKLQALCQYRTQIEIDGVGCWPHFTDLREYEA